jgi:hypothetical protein
MIYTKMLVMCDGCGAEIDIDVALRERSYEIDGFSFYYQLRKRGWGRVDEGMCDMKHYCPLCLAKKNSASANCLDNAEAEE